LGKSVLAVELYDLVANKKIVTFHREGSRCIFSEVVRHREFELTLRLDWGDLREGNPTLDLDVIRIDADGVRQRIKPRHNPKHHTTLSTVLPSSTSLQTYDLEYEGLTMRLVARNSFEVGVGLSAYIVDPEHKSGATPE